MKKISETIVFFGSGPVAAESLKLLVKSFNIETVITKPRPPHHKGRVPVLEIAEDLKLPVLLAQNKQDLDNLIENKSINSRLAILIDFGIIVSQTVIDYFELGIVNSHFSLLPEWRGADPISFAILSGQPKTGVSLMLIDKGMDTGKLISQRSIKLIPTITTPELTDDLIELSNDLLVEYLLHYVTKEITPRSQPHPDRATYSRKLTKQDSVIDWSKPAEQIDREIRAFKGWPGSRATLLGKEAIITQAHVVPSTAPGNKPGDVTIDKEIGGLSIATNDGSLWIEKLKPAGKKEMSAKDFLSGYNK